MRFRVQQNANIASRRTGRRALAVGIVSALTAASLAGCASMTKGIGTGEDVHTLRQQRHEKVVAEFELRRDAAQYQAAMARLRCNDVDGARMILESVAARNAEFLPARLALAEILLEAGQPAQALEHAQFVVDRAPSEAATSSYARREASRPTRWLATASGRNRIT